MLRPREKLKSYSLAEAYELLKRYHLSDSLYLIGQINAAFEFGLQASYDKVPKDIAAWLQRFEKDERMRMQIVTYSTRLARFLLLSGANDHKTAVLRLEDNTYSTALDIVGGIYDVPLEKELLSSTKHLAANILGRMSWQFQLQENAWAHISRAYLLFVEIPAKFSAGYRISEKMYEYFGLDSLSFIATGFALWTKCDGAMGYDLSVEVQGLERVVNSDSQLRFLKVSSGSPEQYRRMIRGEDWKTVNKRFDVYFLDAFSRYPAIKVMRSQHPDLDQFVVPQPKYFIERAASGIFHLLSEKEQELAKVMGKPNINPFRVLFGEIFREYAGLNLSQGDSSKFVDLDRDFRQSEGMKKPDFALLDREVCVLFEVKTSLLTLSARVFFDEPQMQKELEKGSFNKAVEQLDEFRNRILAGEILDPFFKGVKKVICVLVGYEDIYVLNSYLLPMLEEYYGLMARDFQLCTISDIEKLGCLVAEGKPFGKILQSKLSDESLKYYPLMNFLKDHIDGTNKLIAGAGDRFMEAMLNG
jgi:hypothetical protein